MADIPSTLFSKALSTAAKATNLPTVEDETQDLIKSALTDLLHLNSRIIALSVFSPNETLEDISTRDLAYLSVPYVSAEVENRRRTTDPGERMALLDQVQNHLRSYLENLDNYEIVQEAERALYEQKSIAVKDAAKRRDMKIKQYQKEKDLRARIESLRKRRQQVPIVPHSNTDFGLILSLLPSPSLSPTPDDEDDSETDELLRETSLLLLRLFYVQAHAQLESLDQEVELLRSIPPPPNRQSVPSAEDRRSKQKESDDIWKLDAPVSQGGQGPLLDPSGKPLRPFVILPAGASERARLQSQVFGPGHRLPTMAIDEYLEIERQRGNFLTGGGAQSAAEPTSSEQLAVDAETDGTAFGEMKAEEKRQKDENWAQYTDTNPKGAGNTMNRG
ncbi:hypothetical protein SERLA73DRAFT_186691 [Serpula lacrymans var. lacrymans S7.3]|uniref:TAP42-like protein n=2 Tax=Serpula lacrymans var. lacrymans TaxID=341189 RepID=F8Q7Q3_SERL3|nr:uncharacterized protein SERLADRAFT_475869 [Serpula lacrymans var. lacrymans S7.9]EGN95591.1 hypothetical protein SERLA73DRAFT_186691 [Serpula lacrymans var. lacrymans S7.3]EGO21120.1 hypothetical protein SERLADRAFT_475869 [Serpula lacrymans var. lacrymans S7.9]